MVWTMLIIIIVYFCFDTSNLLNESWFFFKIVTEKGQSLDRPGHILLESGSLLNKDKYKGWSADKQWFKMSWIGEFCIWLGEDKVET